MKKGFLIWMMLMLGSLTAALSQNIKYAALFADIERQTNLLLQEVAKVKSGKPDLASPRTVENGELKMVSAKDWTSGFFPGQLWFIYEYTRKNDWKRQAEYFTANLEKEKTNGGTHDMGFKIYSSFGNGYRLTKNAAYRDIIIQSAKTLSTRFNPIVACIRSW